MNEPLSDVYDCTDVGVELNECCEELRNSWTSRFKRATLFSNLLKMYQIYIMPKCQNNSKMAFKNCLQEHALHW